MSRTDAFVQDMLHAAPLSVSADKIAHAALRCAVLLAVLDARGHPVDRTGAGAAVEVYPAASLRRRRLYRPGYEGQAKSEVLADLVEQVLAEAPWLDCGSYRENIRRSDDVFDAVIAAMTARAAARGLTIPPDQDNMVAARAEGWIAIPDSPIGQLV